METEKISPQSFAYKLHTQDRPKRWESESWMLSYIDVFTLITVVFIVLLSFSKPDDSQSVSVEATESLSAESKENIRPKDQQPSSEQMQSGQREGKLAIDSQQGDINLLDKIRQLGLTEQITIINSERFSQIQVQDNLLFASGMARLTEEGKIMLKKIIPILETSDGLIFVEGHTDNVPIDSEYFPSNWELGSARASTVVQYLVTQGMSPQQLRAVSFADTQPIADNKTEVGRSKNRRVSFVLQQ